MDIETGPPCHGWLVGGGAAVQADADGSSKPSTPLTTSCVT